jgi:hypothetical protein
MRTLTVGLRRISPSKEYDKRREKARGDDPQGQRPAHHCHRLALLLDLPATLNREYHTRAASAIRVIGRIGADLGSA